jgi:hypothetical protein
VWCPVCASEFQPGFTRCSDCDIDLVVEEPSFASDLLPARRFADKAVYGGRRYDAAAQLVFESTRSVIRRLHFSEKMVDPQRFVVVASFRDLRYDDIAVAVTEKSSGGCFVRCAVQSEHVRGRTEDMLIEKFFRTLGKQL